MQIAVRLALHSPRSGHVAKHRLALRDQVATLLLLTKDVCIIERVHCQEANSAIQNTQDRGWIQIFAWNGRDRRVALIKKGPND
jgi:hypothetical protein